jgi:hypothetical protein
MPERINLNLVDSFISHHVFKVDTETNKAEMIQNQATRLFLNLEQFKLYFMALKQTVINYYIDFFCE